MKIKTWFKVMKNSIKGNTSLDDYTEDELREMAKSAEKMEKNAEKFLTKMEDKGYKMAKSEFWRRQLVAELSEDAVNEFVNEYEKERGIA